MRKEIRNKINEAKSKVKIKQKFDKKLEKTRRILKNQATQLTFEFKPQNEIKWLANKEPSLPPQLTSSQQIIADWNKFALANGKNPAYMPLEIVEKWLDASNAEQGKFPRHEKLARYHFNTHSSKF